MTSDGSSGSLERSEVAGAGSRGRDGAARGALGRFSYSPARADARRQPRRRRGWSSARQPSLRWAESQRVCSSTKSSTREEGRANTGSRPNAVATNSDDVSATLLGVFFAAGLSSCAVRIFATPGGTACDCLPTGNIFRLHGPRSRTLRPQACAFPPRTLGTLGTNGRGSLAAPPPAPLPAPPRDGALRAAPRNLADARAPPPRPPRAHEPSHARPCTVARLVGLVDLCPPGHPRTPPRLRPGTTRAAPSSARSTTRGASVAKPFLTLPSRNRVRSSPLSPTVPEGVG